VSKIARDPDVFGPGVGAAFRPDDTDLAAMFNKAIGEAQADGSFKKLSDQYFKMDISAKQ
jgi:octopine/nopaline transport system substrate-binding protein